MNVTGDEEVRRKLGPVFTKLYLFRSTRRWTKSRNEKCYTISCSV